MKTKIAIISLVGILLGTHALAASLSLSPASVNVKPGQTFSVAINLNPQGKIYSAKVILRFSPNIVEVRQDTGNQSFTLGPNWMAPEGVVVDNNAGTVSILAGYPKGTETAVLFGTVNFIAKNSGTSTISVDSQSVALGADSKNALTGSIVPVSVNVAAPTPTASAVPVIRGTVATPRPTAISGPTATPIASVPSTPEATPTEASSQTSGNLGATIGNIFTFGTGNNWIGFVVFLLIVGIIWGIYALIKKNRKRGSVN